MIDLALSLLSPCSWTTVVLMDLWSPAVERLTPGLKASQWIKSTRGRSVAIRLR
ncbi:unnamed protein product [Penicillium camemberti]|uniref:Str. FM013 n=1 Tax=Penicillium camemberti (strain FM 013) TaxID=1429867 RepID=A0A0G4NZR8_PENC3|nr:unnamed protein product [Penicillium camemberti]